MGMTAPLAARLLHGIPPERHAHAVRAATTAGELCRGNLQEVHTGVVEDVVGDGVALVDHHRAGTHRKGV